MLKKLLYLIYDQLTHWILQTHWKKIEEILHYLILSQFHVKYRFVPLLNDMYKCFSESCVDFVKSKH